MNIYLIIAILAIITLVLTVSFFKEDFTYNYEMMIETPSKEVVRYKLIKSPYFKKLNSKDLETRQLQGKKLNEIIDFYMENILEINSNENIPTEDFLKIIFSTVSFSFFMPYSDPSTQTSNEQSDRKLPSEVSR